MENKEKQLPPVVIINKNGDVYQHDGELMFTNLTTGQQGALTPELAQKHMKMPVRLNELLTKNPAILNLIQKLQLSIDNS